MFSRTLFNHCFLHISPTPACSNTAELLPGRIFHCTTVAVLMMVTFKGPMHHRQCIILISSYSSFDRNHHVFLEPVWFPHEYNSNASLLKQLNQLPHFPRSKSINRPLGLRHCNKFYHNYRYDTTILLSLLYMLKPAEDTVDFTSLRMSVSVWSVTAQRTSTSTRLYLYKHTHAIRSRHVHSKHG